MSSNQANLQPGTEHVHPHLHHATGAHRGNDQPVYVHSSHPAEPGVTSIPDAHEQKPQYVPADIEFAQKEGYAVNDKEGKNGNDSWTSSDEQTSQSAQKQTKGSAFYRKYRPFFHFFWWGVITAWWVAGLILNRDALNWVVPFLIWLAITIRVVTLWLPASHVMRPIRWGWAHTALPVYNRIPPKFRLPLGTVVVVGAIVIGAFASEETADNTRENRAISLVGIIVLVFGMWASSRRRSAINWYTVLVGFLMQFIIALFVLRSGVGFDIFSFISELARLLLQFAQAGVAFLTNEETSQLGMFFFTVLPAIVFFIALVQVLYYIGFLQWFIGKAAVFFFWAMRVSGAEAVVASATPFIGQGESAMLIKPFVPYLTMAEIHQVMTSGFATIAGSVLVAFLGMGISGQALISACVMSIPASIAMSKMRFPEEEESLTKGKIIVPEEDEDQKAANVIHAFANGAWLGLKIAGMILATLLCIISLVALFNGLLGWFAQYLNWFGDEGERLTIQYILGYLLYPVAFLLGVPRGPDLILVARLLGTKIVINEFAAYIMLSSDEEYADLSPRSRIIATYSLCGFGNIGSLGTQIGVLSQLAPSRSGDVSRVAVSALITGILSTLSSASIAGLVIQGNADGLLGDEADTSLPAGSEA